MHSTCCWQLASAVGGVSEQRQACRLPCKTAVEGSNREGEGGSAAWSCTHANEVKTLSIATDCALLEHIVCQLERLQQAGAGNLPRRTVADSLLAGFPEACKGNFIPGSAACGVQGGGSKW